MNPQEQRSSGSDAVMGLLQATRQGRLDTLLFTELAGPTALKQPLGDHAGEPVWSPTPESNNNSRS